MVYLIAWFVAFVPSLVFAPPTASVSAPVAQTTHPLGCQSGEIFVDAQDWWLHDTSPKENLGHVHTQVCWPYKVTIDKPLTVTVKAVMHANPGTLYRLWVQAWDSGTSGTGCNSGVIACKDFSPQRTLANCTSTGGTLKDHGHTCVWSDTITIDPAKISESGWKEFRIRHFVKQPTGDDMRTSTSLQGYVVNGKTRADDCPANNCNLIEGRGWYTHVNYARARIENPPTGPVSGVWQPNVSMKRGSGGSVVVGHFASLDTDFHNGNRGTVVKEGVGEFSGTLSIDTTKLTNSWHRLFLKTDQVERATGAEHSGILAFWFEVRN